MDSMKNSNISLEPVMANNTYTGTLITDLLSLVEAKMDHYRDGLVKREDAMETMQRVLEMAHAQGQADMVRQMVKDMVRPSKCTCGDIYSDFPTGEPKPNQLDSTCPLHGAMPRKSSGHLPNGR